MHRLDGPEATPAGEFTRGDPSVVPVELPSVVTADILNAFQEEYEGVLDAAGDSPSKGDNEQLVRAIRSSANGGRLGIENLLDNGEFRIWQRRMDPDYVDSDDNPEFPTGGGGVFYGPDRWRLQTAGAATMFLSTADPYHVSPGSTDGEEVVPFSVPLSKALPARTLRAYLAVGWQGTGLNWIAQRIGRVYPYAGHEMTLHILVRSAGSAEEIRAQWFRDFGSGGSPAEFSGASSIGTTSTSEWRHLAFAFTPPAVTGKTIGPGNYLEVRILAPSDPSVLHFAQAFLTLGDRAAPWRPTPFALDWIHCLRHFECSQSGLPAGFLSDDTAAMCLHSSVVAGDATHVAGLGSPFLVRKAATPTMTWYSALNGNADRIEFALGTNRVVNSTIGTSLDHTGYPVVGGVGSGGDALARGHWTADAEL